MHVLCIAQALHHAGAMPPAYVYAYVNLRVCVCACGHACMHDSVIHMCLHVRIAVNSRTHGATCSAHFPVAAVRPSGLSLVMPSVGFSPSLATAMYTRTLVESLNTSLALRKSSM